MKALILCLAGVICPFILSGAHSAVSHQTDTSAVTIEQLLVQVDTLLDFGYAEGVLIYNYPEAVKAGDRALAMARQNASSSLLAQALTKRAKVHWFNGEYPPSIALNNEAIKLRIGLRDSAGLADNYNAIGLNYYYSSDYDTAIAYYNRALNIHKSLRDVSMQRMLLNHIALVYYKMCRYKEVIFYTQEAGRLTEYSESGEPVIQIAAPKTVYRDDVYYRSILKDQFAWLARFGTERKPNRELVMVLRNIAFTYQQLAVYDSTLIYFSLSDKIARRSGIIPHLIDHGNAFRVAGNPDSAIFYYQLAVKETALRGTRIHYHWAHQMMSDAYYDKEQYDPALQFALVSLNVNKEMNNRYSVVGDLIRVARINFLIGHIDEAHKAIIEGLDLSRRIKSHAHTSTLLKLMSQVADAKGLYRQAYEYQQRYELLSDSIASGESDLTLAELQIAYEVNKTTVEIAQLNAANKVQEAQLRNRNVMIISGIVGLVLTTALAIVAYLGYQNKQKTNKTLQQSNREKDLLLGEIHHRVKNNLQVISSILNLQSRKLSDLGAKDAILDGRNRVKAMALIHQQLYQSDRFASIQVEDYLKILINTISESFGYQPGEYALDYRVDNIELDVDSAIHIGLIVNEVVANVFKHAFHPGAGNTMMLRLEEKDNMIRIEIADNGSGKVKLEEDKSGGFGMYLVENLVNDMDGEIRIEKKNGTRVILKLRTYKKAPSNALQSN